MKITCWLMFVVLYCSKLYLCKETVGAKYFNTPIHEVLTNGLYLSSSDIGEIMVSYAGKGSDFRPDDYITHADGVRILSGSLDDFLQSEEKEVLIPVVDTEDVQLGGSKLLGFMLVQYVTPRKLSSRRGEIAFDFEEGGPPPSMKLGNVVVGPGGAKTTRDPDYNPPAHGGGACITGRDCFNFNGTCIAGFCSCKGTYTGSYCQLNRPEYAAISMLVKKNQQQRKTKDTISPQLPTSSSTESVLPKESELQIQQLRDQQQQQEMENKLKEQQFKEQEEFEQKIREEENLKQKQLEEQLKKQQQVEEKLKQQQQLELELEEKLKVEEVQRTIAKNEKTSGIKLNMKKPDTPTHETVEIPKNEEIKQIHHIDTDLDEDSSSESAQESSSESSGESTESTKVKKIIKKKRKPAPKKDESLDQNQAKTEKPLTMSDLYGPEKVYPEAITAGKLPSQIVHERYRKRYNQEIFSFSVRFRNGPFGLSFDNKISDSTVVENVVKGQQSEQSGVQPGDQLIAIDTFNVSDASPKAVQRLLLTLPWPRTLVFQTRKSGEDPFQAKQQLRERTFNITILYPPTLQGEFQLRVSDWSSKPDLKNPVSQDLLTDPRFQSQNSEETQFCPVFRIKSPKDPFGCSAKSDSLSVSETINEIMMNPARPLTKEQEVEVTPMFQILLQESLGRKIAIEPRSISIVKRGTCTFIDKARAAQTSGAGFALIVNNEEELSEMPKGKEKISDIEIPLGISRNSDASLVQLAAETNEVWAVITEGGDFYEPPEKPAPAMKGKPGSKPIPKPIVKTTVPIIEKGACGKIIQLAEEILDRWPHSQPYLSTNQIMKNQPVDQSKVRTLPDEGGRIAISGENGWAFFDYHLAMFGPQEVPLGPQRLQMALPPFGCDPNAYTVRISGTIVAILRGGGCSFGIKVINAQKLGAKAVIIVNTDDKKTMRLMALEDEIPLINISCIMVSRRIQYYLEQMLVPHYLTSQHLVSIQPTGVFGEYEKTNSVQLPVRLSNS